MLIICPDRIIPNPCQENARIRAEEAESLKLVHEKEQKEAQEQFTQELKRTADVLAKLKGARRNEVNYLLGRSNADSISLDALCLPGLSSSRDLHDSANILGAG